MQKPELHHHACLPPQSCIQFNPFELNNQTSWCVLTINKALTYNWRSLILLSRNLVASGMCFLNTSCFSSSSLGVRSFMYLFMYVINCFLSNGGCSCQYICPHTQHSSLTQFIQNQTIYQWNEKHNSFLPEVWRCRQYPQPSQLLHPRIHLLHLLLQTGSPQCLRPLLLVQSTVIQMSNYPE